MAPKPPEHPEPIDLQGPSQPLSLVELEVIAQPPPPPNEGQAPPAKGSSSVLDAALADAKAADWQLRRAELMAELEADASMNKARAALLNYELGEISEEHLQDEAGAVRLYSQALKLDPSLRPNLWAIRRIFLRRGLWPNLVKLIDAEIRFGRDDAERADLYAEKGYVLEDHLSDREGAKASYEKAIALDPRCQTALLARERIAFLERDDEALIRVWRGLADATEPRRKLGYLLDLARLLARRKGEEARALEVMREAAALGTDLGIAGAQMAALGEQLAEATGDSQALMAALEVRLALCQEEPQSPNARGLSVALLRKQAQVALKLGDTERAWACLERAEALASEDPLVLRDKADLAEQLGRFGDLAELCQQLMTTTADGLGKVVLGLRRARALAHLGTLPPGEVDAALHAVAPGSMVEIAFRERRALEAGDWEGLAAAYLAEAGAARAGTAFGPPRADTEPEPDPQWAASALVRAGDVFDLRLGQKERAQSAYGEALEVCPGYLPALCALAVLQLRDGRLDQAAPESETLLMALAWLHDAQGRSSEAAQALAQLVERRPDDLHLRRRLEVLSADADPSEARVKNLESLAAAEPDPSRQAFCFRTAARVCEALGPDHDAHAHSLYRQAVAAAAEGPGSDEGHARAALCAFFRRTGRWEELAEALRAEADRVPHRALRALREAAFVLEHKLRREGEARTIYREILDRVPDSPAALRGLARTSSDPEDDELAAVLERETLLAPLAEAGPSFVVLGELYERLGRNADAAAAYRKACAAGVDGHAVVALLELGRKAGNGARVPVDPALIEVLDKMAHQMAQETGSASLRAEVLEELAWMEGDPNSAVARFEEATQHAQARHPADPGRESTLLGRWLQAARAGATHQMSTVWTELATTTTDASLASAFLGKAAALSDVSGKGDGPALAMRAWGLASGDVAAIVAAAERPASRDVAPQTRADVLTRRAALAVDPASRTALELDRAQELECAGHLAEAGRILGAVLGEDPDNLRALQAVRRIARRAGDKETWARVSLRIGGLFRDADSAAAFLAEGARLLEHDLRRRGEARTVWREVLERAPLNDEALRRAKKLAISAADDASLDELFEHRMRHVRSPRDEIPQRLERAVLRHQRGELAGAVEDLEKALAIDECHVPALFELVDVKVELGDYRTAVLLLEKIAQLGEAPHDATFAELRRANLLFHELADPDGAIKVLEQRLEAAPQDLEVREQLVEMLEARGEWERAAQEIQDLGLHRGDARLRARDELRAGAMFYRRLSQPQAAREALLRARTLDPVNLEVVRELAFQSLPKERTLVLENAVADVRHALSQDPRDIPLYETLSAIGEMAGDKTQGRFAQSAVRALRRKPDEPVFDPLPTGVLSAQDLRSRLAHPGVHSPWGEIWACIAPSLAQLAAASSPSKGDRVSPKQLAREFPVVDAWTRAMGLAEVEVFVSHDPEPATRGRARAVALDPPVLMLGVDVACAATVEARCVLGATLLEARDRSGRLKELPGSDLWDVFGAAASLGGADPKKMSLFVGVDPVAADEWSRALARVMPRRDRKALALAVAALGHLPDLDGWRASQKQTAFRAGLLLCGNVPVAMAMARAGGADRDSEADLLRFAVSEAHMMLRKELGLG